MKERDRCEECGAIQLNDPLENNPEERLKYLGYLGEDTYHDLEGEDGQTYHGHSIKGDSFNEVKQNHDSDDAHERAREAFARSNSVCPRHYDAELVFCKSVAPRGNPDQNLYAQGKCPECEDLTLIEV